MKFQIRIRTIKSIISKKLLFITILIYFFQTPLTLAQNRYDLSWWTINGSGGVSQSEEGNYTMHSIIGQPEVGQAMSGGQFSVIGGYINSMNPPTPTPQPLPNKIYLPIIIRF